jgi:hypothetical protein
MSGENLVEEELDIIECLEDYHRILMNVATNASQLNGSRKRSVAHQRAQMVRQLIFRLKTLSDEPEPRSIIEAH